jgi:hypothetical protein
VSAPRAGDHGVYDELAVGWALHSLEPEDEALFARHLPDCDRCARTVAETADVMAALATDLPQAEPSPELRNRLRAAVERTEQVPPHLAGDADGFDELVGASEGLRTVVPDPPRAAGGFPLYEPRRPGTASRPAWRRALPTALVAAAVAAVLGLGTWNVMLAESRNRAQEQVASEQQLVDSLLRPGQATISALTDDGRRVATVVARDSDVQVVAEGLPVNDTVSSVYVVWGMGDQGAVPLGTFDVIRSQTELRPVSSEGSGLDDYSAYAISIEQGRDMPDKPTKVMAQS